MSAQAHAPQIQSDTQSDSVALPTAASHPSKAFALDTADAIVANLLAKQESFPPSADLQIDYSSPAAGRSGKESIAATSPDTALVDAGAAIQYVEQEKNPEIPVEVEGFLQHVESNTQQAPEEIILADLQHNVLPKKVPKQSVVVLPITPETEKAGAKKSPFYSIKWLVEWSRKLIKMFEGTIVYRPTDKRDN